MNNICSHTICLWKSNSCRDRLRRNSKQRNWWYLSSLAYSGQLNDQMNIVSSMDSDMKYKSMGPGRVWLVTSSVNSVTACWKCDMTQLISSWSISDFWKICKICFQCCRRTWIWKSILVFCFCCCFLLDYGMRNNWVFRIMIYLFGYSHSLHFIDRYLMILLMSIKWKFKIETYQLW